MERAWPVDAVDAREVAICSEERVRGSVGSEVSSAVGPF